jgi:hypothetical protein
MKLGTRIQRRKRKTSWNKRVKGYSISFHLPSVMHAEERLTVHPCPVYWYILNQ